MGRDETQPPADGCYVSDASMTESIRLAWVANCYLEVGRNCIETSREWCGRVTVDKLSARDKTGAAGIGGEAVALGGRDGWWGWGGVGSRVLEGWRPSRTTVCE